MNCGRQAGGGGYGNWVTFDHGNGVVEFHGHLHSCDPSTGVAIVGSTGDSTGNHSHYEVRLQRPDGSYTQVDPQLVWKGDDLCDQSVRNELFADARNRLSNTQTTAPPSESTGGTGPTPPPAGGGSTSPPGAGGGGGGFAIPPGHGGQGGQTPGTVGTVTGPPQVPNPRSALDYLGETGFPNDIAGYDSNPDKQWSSRSCDGDVMNVIFGQAYLQAQRDVLVGQMLIKKPDSVLEYTCFPQFLSYAAYEIPPIFSENQDDWREFQHEINITNNLNAPVTPQPRPTREITTGWQFWPPELHRIPGLMADSLELAVYQVSLNYLYNNFWHRFLGDMAPFGGFWEFDPGAGTWDFVFPPHLEFPTLAEGASYTCDMMAQVWQVAKCENFIDPFYPSAYQGLFYSFEDLVHLDPRTDPFPYLCEESGISETLIELAENLDFEFARYNRPEPPIASWTYTELLEPGECDRHPPIPTGITAHRTDTIITTAGLITDTCLYTYPEFICAQPGCFYDRASERCTDTPPVAPPAPGAACP